MKNDTASPEGWSKEYIDEVMQFGKTADATFFEQGLTKHYFSHNRNQIKIPSIVLFELYYGAEKSQKREHNLAKIETFITEIETFITEIEIVPFCENSATIVGKIRAELERQGMPIGGNDILISATVLANNGIAVTNNINEFSRIKGLVFEDWTRLSETDTLTNNK